MKIGIDARLIAETGVGRYIYHLIEELGREDRENQYVVFLRKDGFSSFRLPNDRWKKRLADVPWHSFQEQLILPWIFGKEHLDLLHVPYFNVPILYLGTYVMTIHDLIILHFSTGRATTLPMFFYKLRRLGYLIAIQVGIWRAKKIITVSHTTKREIIDHFHVDASRIAVTYESVDKNIFSAKQTPVVPAHALGRGTYFLYVGNAYPHKNVELLIHAFGRLIQKHPLRSTKIQLVLVGKEDLFYRRLKNLVQALGISENVIFWGKANDNELQYLYVHARSLIFPSHMEGFGLPALEAFYCGCPVICSDISVFHELFGDLPTYFDPTREDQLVSVLETALQTKKDPSFKKKAALWVSRYSWKSMAKETLRIYQGLTDRYV